MKKTIIYFAIFLLAAPMAMAQKFESGDSMLSAGLGVGGAYGVDYSPTQSPGFGVSYERGIWDIGGPGVISLGGYLGFKSYKYGAYYNDAKFNYTIIGAKGTYHFNGLDVDQLDLYGGIMLSANILSVKNDYPGNSNSSELGVSPYVGARWFFSDAFGVFAEVGYGVAYFTVGASYKF